MVNQAWHHLTFASQACTLFVNKQGRSFQGSYSTWWKEAVCPLIGATFSPRWLRHIWVEARMDGEEEEGPSHQDAAVVMGNSLEQWVATYHTTYRGSAAARAVARMDQWRAACLKVVAEEREAAQGAKMQQAT